MKKTRNLFVLAGSVPDELALVLSELQFKGLITNPYGLEVTSCNIEEAFQNNKSFVCACDDYFTVPVPTQPPIMVYVNPDHEHPNSIFTEGNDIAESFATIANNLGCDIGDHKSNSSGLNGIPTQADCVYCKYLKGDKDINERVVYKSENFFVFPTIGQFIKGYLLIIPFKHIMSNGELSQELIAEFKEVLDDVEYIIKKTYNVPNVLVWENGSGELGIGKAKDSIVHAHVHIAPSNLTTVDVEQQSGFPFKKIVLENLTDYKEHSYLLIRTPDSNTWEIDNEPKRYIPRQYIRQILAEEHNIPGEQWNWRTYPFSDNLHETVIDITNMLKANWSDLPERIKKNTSFLLESS